MRIDFFEIKIGISILIELLHSYPDTIWYLIKILFGELSGVFFIQVSFIY